MYVVQGLRDIQPGLVHLRGRDGCLASERATRGVHRLLLWEATGSPRRSDVVTAGLLLRRVDTVTRTYGCMEYTLLEGTQRC